MLCHCCSDRMNCSLRNFTFALQNCSAVLPMQRTDRALRVCDVPALCAWLAHPGTASGCLSIAVSSQPDFRPATSAHRLRSMNCALCSGVQPLSHSNPGMFGTMEPANFVPGQSFLPCRTCTEQDGHTRRLDRAEFTWQTFLPARLRSAIRRT
jgi:hypothetical protein